MKTTLKSDSLIRTVITESITKAANKYFEHYGISIRVDVSNVNATIDIEKYFERTVSYLKLNNDHLFLVHKKHLDQLLTKELTSHQKSYVKAGASLGLLAGLLKQTTLEEKIAFSSGDPKGLSLIAWDILTSVAKFSGYALIFASVVALAKNEYYRESTELELALQIISHHIDTFIDLQIKNHIKSKYKQKKQIDAADLECPITHEIFIDPVTANDGRNYERSALQECYNRGRRNCIVNPDESLSDPKTLKTNYTLKNICETYKKTEASEYNNNCHRSNLDNNNNNQMML